MPKAYPKEFRDDVVAVARQGQAPLTQIAKDFGVSEGCVHGWMKKADARTATVLASLRSSQPRFAS